MPNLPFTIITGQSQPQVRAVAPAVSSAPTTFVKISPENGISDLTKTSGTVTFDVVVNNTVPFNAFLVSLIFQKTSRILGANSKSASPPDSAVDPTGNMLGPVGSKCPSNAQDTCANVFRYCIDGSNVVDINTPCTRYDGAGVLTYGLYLLGNRTSQGTNGLLFAVNFNVLGTGFSQVQVVFATLANGAAALSGKGTGQINVGRQDSYFTNIACPTGSGVPCKPMNNDFSVNPPLPSVGRGVNFTATVIDLNANSRSVSYNWTWGDPSLGSSQTGDQIGKQINHVYSNVCFCPVTLIVTDNYGVSWSFTKAVQVVNIFLDLTASPPDAIPNHGVYPGVQVAIKAIVYNNSTLPINNATINISLEGKLLKSGTFNLDARGGSRPVSGTIQTVWDTSGLIPRVYRVDVIVPPVPNENITSNNSAFTYVQLIVPQPGGLSSLSIFQAAGVGIIVLVGAGFALVRLIRKPSYLDEPL